MKKIFRKTKILLLVIVSVVIGQTAYAEESGAKNNYPIIMVGGWMSWGRAELEGLKYWGGLSDIQQLLRDKGYEVYTAEVSPVGSNWDRACELYAQIRGGVVDYGLGHSAYFGHAETTAKVYPGLYPLWGTVDPATGKTRKVHLVGHSMGAQTIRLLAHLLENGSPTEMGVAAQYPAYSPSPLFTGSSATKNLVASVTSISGPHDGNTLVYLLGDQNVFNSYANFFTYLTSLAATDPAIDLKVDQWGIFKNAGESDVQFIIRTLTASPLAASLDSSLVDLSPQGAAFLNTQVKAQPDIYYFSYATNDTHADDLGFQVPNDNMNPFLVPGSRAEGMLTGQFGTPPFPIDGNWWANDGLLPTFSQNGPKVNSTDIIIDKSALTDDECYGDGVFSPGVWNYMGVKENTDHYAVLGLRNDDPATVAKDLCKYFNKIARILRHLP